MTYVAGIYIPDDIYSSLVSVIQTEQNVLKSSGLGFLCNPAVQLLLPLNSGVQLLCLSAEAVIGAAAAKLANLVNQTEQEVIQQINQAQAQGEKVTALTFNIKAENALALTLQKLTVIPNPLANLTISQITNLEMKALQAGINQFNSTTLYSINNHLAPEGWYLNPLSLSYDSNTDTFIINATYQKMHTPDPQGWMILVILAILAIVAFIIYVVVNAYVQTQNIQYKKTVAQNAYQLYQQCLQDTNNNVQLCEQLMNNYFKGTQPLSTDILIGIGIAAALIGAGILVYDYGKRGDQSVIGKAKNALGGSS